MQQNIRLDFYNFWQGFEKEDNFFINLLRKRFSVKISHDADFVICSLFGTNIPANNKAIRIFFTGENVRPNFDIFHYALSFDHKENISSSLQRRHFRLPLYRFYAQYLPLKNRARLSADTAKKILDQKRHFCNFIYSNNNCAIRDNFFRELNLYRWVDSAGKHLNNQASLMPIVDKIEFQSKCKFSIAFENTEHPGYTTEKLLHALSARTVPIYWGNPLVYRDFNPLSFINSYDFESQKSLIEYIKKVDQNDDLYLQYLQQPPFTKEQTRALEEREILSFFDKIFNSPAPQIKTI